MNKLDGKARARILHHLCDGQSLRAITRIEGVSKNTVAKLLSDAGAVCTEYQDRALMNLTSRRIQVDEIWSFTYARQKNVAAAKAGSQGAGDTWTWTAIDADTKLAMAWLVGGRDSEYAMALMDDIAKRLTNKVQLTNHDHKSYLEAVEEGLGEDIDYAMLIKLYGAAPEAANDRYNHAVRSSLRAMRAEGDPEAKNVSTFYAERQDLTTRTRMRRFTRLPDAYSKKVSQHANALALHFMYYNFVRTHSSIRVSPAMAAGVTDRLWEIGDIVALIEAQEAGTPRSRGPYKTLDQISN
jgi:IS1 family transposase